MMKLFVRILLATAVALCGAVWSPVTASAAGDPVGVFTRVEGSVDILSTRDLDARPVRQGDPVYMADAVRTKRDGKAEIHFKDDTTLQLAPETRIIIDEYTYQGNTRQKGFLSLLRGKVRAIVSKVKASVIPVAQSDSNFMIKTPTAIAGVKGTDLIVSFERGITGVFFLDGFGFVFNPSRPERVIPVGRGQGTFVTRGDRAPLAARNLQSAFVAPYLKETTPNGTSAGNGEGGSGTTTDAGGGSAALTSTNVVMANSGFEVLIDPESVVVTTGPLSATLTLPGANLPGNQGQPGNDTIVIPISESHPEVLNLTNVTVKVRIP